MLLWRLPRQPPCKSGENDVDGAQDPKNGRVIDVLAGSLGEFDDDLSAFFWTCFGNPSTNTGKLRLSHGIDFEIRTGHFAEGHHATVDTRSP